MSGTVVVTASLLQVLDNDVSHLDRTSAHLRTVEMGAEPIFAIIDMYGLPRGDIDDHDTEPVNRVDRPGEHLDSRKGPNRQGAYFPVDFAGLEPFYAEPGQR